MLDFLIFLSILAAFKSFLVLESSSQALSDLAEGTYIFRASADCMQIMQVVLGLAGVKNPSPIVLPDHMQLTFAGLNYAHGHAPVSSEDSAS